MWRDCAPTIGNLIDQGWPVAAHCLSCGLAMEVDLNGLVRKLGPNVVLWGRTARCRRRHCVGRMYFSCRPPRAGGDVPMFSNLPSIP